MTTWRGDLADDAIELARDVAVARMRRRGWPWRQIARFLRSPESTLRSRFEAMPPDVRQFYEVTPLDEIGL